VRRSYDQYCTLARALDVVGERWTLLIVRELMLGPRRFKDLLHGLPGIGRNLLAARMRHLEVEGLVRRTQLPPPAGSRVYELTEDGRALGPAMAELSRWGVSRLEPPRPGVTFRPAWGVFPLSYGANAEAARGVRESYEFRVDEETFHLEVDDGKVEPYSGPAHSPDVVFTMSEETLLGLLSGAVDPAQALSEGRVLVVGSPEAIGHALTILAGDPATATAAP
jgi:DNA-binding HxlR family transcriptional regulator